jgi:hypothetical protein
MPSTRNLLMLSGGVAVVLVSFVVTTYVLDRFSSGSELPIQPSTSTSMAQTTSDRNLLWPSQDFASPKWERYQIAAIVPAAAIAPDGTKSASQLIESGDNGRHFIDITAAGATPGAVHTFSVYFKPSERNIRFEMRDSTPGKYGTVMCDVPKAGSNGSSWVKGGDVVDGAVEDAGNGWYRCWAAMPFPLPNVVLSIELRDKNGTLPYQGDGHSGELIWGAQFERGSRPSAYVATNTDPVAKAN